MTLSLYIVPTICEPLASQPITASVTQNPSFIELDLADNADGASSQCTDLLIGSDYYWDLVTGGIRRENGGLTAIHTKLGWVLSGPVSGQDSARCLTNLTSTHVLWADTQISDTTHSFEHSGSLSHLAYPRKKCQYMKPSLRLIQGLTPMEGILWTSTWQLLPQRQETTGVASSTQPRAPAPSLQVWPWETYNILLYILILYSSFSREELQEYSEWSQWELSTSGGLSTCGGSARKRRHQMLPPWMSVFTRAQGSTSWHSPCYYGSAPTVALTADVEKAFLMILVSDSDHDVLRFLWVDDINKKEPELRVFRFTRVVFGVSSSQFLLNATIRFHLERYMESDASTVQMLLQSTYLDNIITGAESEE